MVVWVDSFSDCFAGGGVEAVVEVLAAAGYAPRFLDRTGLLRADLDQHRPAATAPAASCGRRLDVLHPVVAAGIPVVGLEPSCTAVWRSDAAELLPDDAADGRGGRGVLTLAELLSRTEGWSPPDLSGGRGRRPAALPPRVRAGLGRPTPRC